jgi:hypothetical protein
MPSSGILGHAALARTVVSEERIASIIRLCCVHRLLVTANIPSSPILVTLMMEAIRSFETSVLSNPQEAEWNPFQTHYLSENFGSA